MSNAMSLRVPKTLYDQIKTMAEEEGISLNQFVLLAVAEKVARQQAFEYLDNRFARLQREFMMAKLDPGSPGYWE